MISHIVNQYFPYSSPIIVHNSIYLTIRTELKTISKLGPIQNIFLCNKDIIEAVINKEMNLSISITH